MGRNQARKSDQKPSRLLTKRSGFSPNQVRLLNWERWPDEFHTISAPQLRFLRRDAIGFGDFVKKGFHFARTIKRSQQSARGVADVGPDMGDFAWRKN